jgi:hypothetical protein
VNTPAHLAFNALVLGRARWQQAWLPITAGALLPDLPMLVFYLYQRGVLATPEQLIWSHAYFQHEWQFFFDLFNSLPLLGVGALIALRARASSWLAFFASMVLHCLADLPLHHDDAHAHFFPLSGWRFHSPVSYWDPEHYGRLFAVAELALVAVGATTLIRRPSPWAWRFIGVLTLAAYAGFVIFALLVWL